MANKSFSRLSSRNQSTLVSQLHKLISYYSSIFCTRERVYIKNLTKQDGSVYWLEDDTRKLMAVAILDPNYKFKIGDIEFITLGHTISNKPGQMERLLHHIFTDHEDKNIILICKSFVAESIDFSEYGLTKFNPLQLSEFLPELASVNTNYFNVHNENLASGLARKEHFAYIRFSNKDLETISKKFPKLKEFIDSGK